MNFRHEFTVGFSQCDSAGVMFFSRIFEIVHLAYEEWIISLGLTHAEWFSNSDWAVPLKSCQAEYFQPMKQGEKFSAGVELTRVGEHSFQLAWRVLQDNKLVCKVTTDHVFVDNNTFTKREIPKIFFDIFPTWKAGH